MIVTTRAPRRKRAAKPAQTAEIKVPNIVQHRPRWKREPKPLAPDPEAEASVAAFFARMGIRIPEKD